MCACVVWKYFVADLMSPTFNSPFSFHPAVCEVTANIEDVVSVCRVSSVHWYGQAAHGHSLNVLHACYKNYFPMQTKWRVFDFMLPHSGFHSSIKYCSLKCPQRRLVQLRFALYCTDFMLLNNPPYTNKTKLRQTSWWQCKIYNKGLFFEDNPVVLHIFVCKQPHIATYSRLPFQK